MYKCVAIVVRFTVFVGLLGGSASVAAAQTLITTAPAAASANGPGLRGLYYGTPNVGSVAQADAYIASNTAEATFTASAVDYPQGSTQAVGDGTTLASFLGSDAASLSNPALGTNTLFGQLMEFSGYIDITSSMDLDTSMSGIQIGLGTQSDDGSVVRIGSQTVLDDDGPHIYGGVSGFFTFSTAGWYAVDVRYFEEAGGTGVELDATYTGGASNGSSIVAPTSILARSIGSASAPEPSGLAMLVLTLPVIVATIFLWQRRRDLIR